jgi:hypothetical protein
VRLDASLSFTETFRSIQYNIEVTRVQSLYEQMETVTRETARARVRDNACGYMEVEETQVRVIVKSMSCWQTCRPRKKWVCVCVLCVCVFLCCVCGFVRVTALWLTHSHTHANIHTHSFLSKARGPMDVTSHFLSNAQTPYIAKVRARACGAVCVCVCVRNVCG